jgi:hypothetical protein
MGWGAVNGLWELIERITPAYNPPNQFNAKRFQKSVDSNP